VVEIMKRRLYDLMVPGFLKEKLYRMHVRQYETEEWGKRKAFEESLPHSELSSIYIKNLKIIVNRNDLLNLMPRDAVVIEIGSRSGDFSYQILVITKPQKLYLIEDWSTTDQKQNLSIISRVFDAQIQTDQINLRSGSPLVEIKKIPDGSVDWIYLNPDNTFSGTLDLLEQCQLKVKEGGLIAGNNYSIGEWIDIRRYGVIEAVNTFCKKYGWEMVYLTNESDRFLSYALKKI
jgi:hypothetical protein